MSADTSVRVLSAAEFALLSGFTLMMMGGILFVLSFPEMADRFLRWSARLDKWLARYLFLGRFRRTRAAASETWIKTSNAWLVRAVSLLLLLIGTVLIFANAVLPHRPSG